MISFTKNGIDINGIEKPLYSGAVHYWRIKRDNWSKILDEICNMGFEIVETYIPWSVHEYEEGSYDFGEIEENKDLDGFLTLCEKKGLSVIVRPGPHINAELTLFGYPKWILQDEEIQAKNPWGTTVVYPYVTGQFPIPSYASDKLYVKTEEYFRIITPILKRHIGENGCIIAIQADNETCNFFRDRPYIMDYSAASIHQYHNYLKEKYKTIEKLNMIYGSDYAVFDHIIAPSGFCGEAKEDLPYYFDWVEYKEYQILFSLERMLKILKNLNLSIPVFHNCAYQNYTPISVQRDEALDGLSIAGMDAYQEPGDTAMLQERIRYLAGSSKLAFVPEFGSGSWFDRECLLTPEEEEYGYLYSFMNGLKAINFYMLVERDRWTGCPITVNGRRRDNYYEMFQKMIHMLKETEIHLYQRKPVILVMKNYDMGRFKALYSLMDLNMLSSNCFIKGPDIPAELFKPEVDLGLYLDQGKGHYAEEDWVSQVSKALNEQHYDFNYSDQYLSYEKWLEYDVIFASTYDFMDEGMQNKLISFANQKGKRLIIGPCIPYLDRNFKKCTILQDEIIREGRKSSITLVQNPDQFAYDLMESASEYSYQEENIEISVHKHPKESKHLLFIANHAKERKIVELRYQKIRSFSEVWNAKGIKKQRMLAAEIPPFAISIWSVLMEEETDDKQ